MKKLLFILLFSLSITCASNAQEEQIPGFLFGKPFIEQFQKLYTKSQYALMIQYTSDKSIAEYGEKAILNYYKDYIKFSYPLIYRNSTVSITEKKDTVYNFDYFVQVDYTDKKAVTFHVIIENGTSKILLDNLNFNFVDTKKTKIK